MGRYGGWGAADGVFAPGASGNDLRDRERLRTVLARLGGSEQAGERLFNAAGLTVLNAHYTDPVLVRAIYRALADLGLEQGTIVEPGVGAGQFAAFAPDGIRITGIELDPGTALIAQLLHPDAEILVGSVSGPRFSRVRDQSASPVRVPRDTADGFAGNVPFSDVKWPDDVLNPGTRFPLHDHAILWGVTRVAPGGLCAFITSRYTADKQNPGFRRTLAGEMDLIGMVRLPSTAHKRMAGTQVVTDIIIGRRLADGERPRTDPEAWEQARPLPLPGSDLTALVNTYFHANPRHVLGKLQAGGMRRADDFSVVPSGDLEEQLGAALGEIVGRALAAGQRHEPRPAARPVIEILSRRPDGTVTANPDGTFTQVVHGQDVPLKIDSAREADQTRKLVALAEARAALIRAEVGCPEDTDETDAMRARMGELYDAYTGAYGAIGRFTVRTTNYHVKTFKGVLDRLDFSKVDVPDPEVTLLEAYLGREALTRIVTSAADPGHVRHGTRKDKQGNEVATQTQLVQVASVRAALMAALAEIPQGADAERLTAAFGERMSRIETGEQRTRLMPVAFRSDPRRPAVEALENFDPVTQTAVKKPVFSRRTAVPHRLELGADTPQEALDLVLIHHRRVDLPEIARLLGTDAPGAREQLGTLVFDDPAVGGALVAAGEYLSGNVHEKLAAARTAAAGDPRYAVNVESLLAIQPRALGYEDIQARLGSAWLSRQIVRDGLRHILDDPTITVTHPGGAGWTVSSRKGPDAENPYGTSDWSALDMAQALLTNDSIAVYRKRLDPQTGEEKSYRDDHATLYNYRRAQRLDADFVSWLWSDPDRAEQCVRLYNRTYNNQVKRRWDSSPFLIPGLAPGMRLHPFQNAMVRRLHTESGLAAWVVGAGKTELGIVAAMEGHRLGRHGLCAIVCPASLVNQWRDRIYRTYPGAGVLVADDDLRARRDALEMFVERAASRDYQLAVVPYEFFASLSLSADAARASVDEEIDKLTRYAQEAAAQGDSYTAKSLQKQIARLEAQYSAVALASGGATGFTDARITGLVIDEWHHFRRFRRDSNNREFAMDGSDRANHMLTVADHLRRHHPEGLVLGLSGTPLEQSIADAWAAMRFFAPGRLKALGLEEFDAFLTTFGRTEARREPTPTGSGLHVRERASDWFNLPEMRRALWDPFADVVRSADLGLNVPRIAGGRPQTHVLPQTPGQASVQAEIDDGYARFKAGIRGEDNHILRLMDRGAKNALHPRMLGMEADGQVKLEVWADAAAAWYHASKDARFLDREGNPHPVPGALRMVACELGVPDPARPNAWSVYAEMRSLLAARGVPVDKVRFAQDAAGSDRKKAALWEDARTGRCNFVIGSAQTAGTGVDVPDRLQVLDFMTLGWNPTQFEQWLGRIIRQGNQNPEVAVHVWSTEGTTEVLRADKIAMKSAPFEALLDGDSGARRVTEESFNQTSAFAAEMSARMSGNPLLNAQREAQLDVDTAQGMQDQWQRENGVKARRIPALNSEIRELEEQNAAIDRAQGRAVDTQGDKFAAQVGTARYTVRAEAGAALIAALAATAAGDVTGLVGGTPQHLGELAGFPVTARYNRFEPDPPAPGEDGQGDEPARPEPGPAERTLITLGLEGVPNGQVGMISGGDLPDRDPVALITSLEGRIRRLPGDRDKNTAAIAENRDQIAKTKAELAKPSPYLQQLADARDALDRIETQIDEQIKETAPEADAVASADAESVPASPGETSPEDSAEPAISAAAPPDRNAADLPGAEPAGTADRDGPAPSAPAESGVGPAGSGYPRPPGGTEQPGPGMMTSAELDFVYQHALDWALRGIASPNPDQHERALDYAAWYLAEFRDEDSMADLPGHDHAWNWFIDRGYPARDSASAVGDQRDKDQPPTEAAAESDTLPGPAAPEPPGVPWSAARLRDLADAYRLRSATDRTGGTLTLTVHDHGRTVLTHDDLTGTTTAGGRRLDPGQVTAYIAAYASSPQLPPRCLHDLARNDTGEPNPLTPTAAREIAARHGLEVRVRRINGQSYITFCEPGIPGEYPGAGDIPAEPVLSYPAGSDTARHGPCAVPVAAIGSYLAAYRENVPPAMLTAREPYDWRARLVPLTPYLIDGGGHFMPAVRDRLRAAITAGRDDRAAEAAAILAEAEELAPLVLTPEREAELVAAVRRDAASYPPAEDLAAASRRTLHVTARELDWVRAHIADHPGVREHAEDEPAAAQASDREAMANLVTQAREALARGEHARALALIDETELIHPGNAAEYDRARNQVHEAMRLAGVAPAQPAAATAAQEPDAQASGADTQPGSTPARQPDAVPGSDDSGQRATAGSESSAPPTADARAGLPGTATGEAGSAGQRGARLPRTGPASPSSAAAPEVPGFPRVTVLHGHTSPETAYLVDDYPYGRLRCEKRYWLETADKGRYRGQLRLVTQTTNPKQPGRPWNKPHPEQYRAWSVMYLNQDGHVKVHSISDWGPSGGDDARMRLDGTYDQLAGEERAAYDQLAERGRRGRNWDSWYDALGFVRSYQAEHGTLPDVGQVQAAPGFYADDAISRMAIAAVAAGLGGVHAGPGALASPAAGTPAGAPPARAGESTDGTRQVLPAAPEDPGGNEPAPGQGFDWGGADFRHELAYAFALGSNPPGSSEDERARDYAAWYMARHGGEEPAGEMPAHSIEWRRFAELGYPARAPAAEQAEAGTAASADDAVAADISPAGPASGSTSTEESTKAPAATPPGPDTDDLDAGRRQPSGTAAPTAPAPAAEPETASPGADQAADVPGTVEPDPPGPYSDRVRVNTESRSPTVSGTTFEDPAELRAVLRANFTWRKTRQVWEYTGRSDGPEEAAQAVRDVLARLDRESAPAPAAKEFPPTPQQQAILDAFLDGKGIAVQALAGTGKTTTLVLLARALMDRSPQARIVYTAFNASIVKDAKRGRFGRNVTASTMHSLARQALLQTGYAGKIEHADKGARWPEQWAEVLGIPEGTAAETRDAAAPADAAEVARLVMATVRKFRESADGEPGRQHLPYLAGPAGSPLSETVLSYARQAWADISDTGNARQLAAGRALRVEHDDYLKVWALTRPRIDAQVIFFDEAQDVNDVMRSVVLDQSAQTVVVGDSHQSIYGFRGAIDALKDWPADIVLPLTQSWRFGPAAAGFGNLFLRSLGSKLLLEGNPAQETRLGSAPEPDAILCRTNATAVAEVFNGLESGKRTALAGGGDAIKEIAKAARDLQVGKGTRHPDLSRFTDWDEVRQYARNDEDGKSLQVFVRLIDQHGPSGLIDMIGRLTPEDDTHNPPQLTISTAHKAKGLEWDVVRIAGDFRGPATDPETGEATWPVPEERRLAYVAATRARKLLEPGSLTWIYDYPLPGARAAQGPASGQDRQAQAAAPDAARHTASQPEPAAQEQEPAPQDFPAPAPSQHSAAGGTPGQQPAPTPAIAEAPASVAASGQATDAAEPDVGHQGPADGTGAGSAALGQASAAAGPGSAQPDDPPLAAEPEPAEAGAVPPSPATQPGGNGSPAAGETTAESAPGTGDGAESGEQAAAATTAHSDSGTAPGTSPDTAGQPSAADAAARLRALAAQHELTVTADQVSPAVTLTTITDGDRIVLRHDDIAGTRADGIPTGLDEADAYLDAWRAYPGLPARALLDWVRRSPDDPAQLSLSAARAIAEDYGLVAEPVRAAGQQFIVFRLPGRGETVLACRPGGPAASTGLVTVPVPAIRAYLRAYRAAVEPRWLTAFGQRGDWAAQLTALAPYLINATSLYSAEARRHVDAAAGAAARDDDSTVKDELRAAWAAAGPFVPAPDREAMLLRVIGDVVPRYQQLTGDGARYAAEVADASGPEWDWIYQHVRDHPDVLTTVTLTHEALEQRDADEHAQAAAEGDALSKAAKAAFDSGDYPAALALIDQGETTDPGRIRWQQARALILDKSAAPRDTPQPETAVPPASATGAGEFPPQQAAAEPGAAGTSASADASPGTDDGAESGEPSLLAVPAGREEGVQFLREVAERYGLRVSAVIDTLQWWTVHLSTLDYGSGVHVASYDSRTGEWKGSGAGSRLGPGQIAAYLVGCGEGDLQDVPAGPDDPYTRIGQARSDYHKALLAYRALRETKAGRFLVETLAGEKPRPDSNRPDAITLDSAYQAVNGGWKTAFAGDAQEAAGRFAAWAHAASVMAGNLAAQRHRAGKFRQALDIFTVTAGHLASRTQATARDPSAWAHVFEGLRGSTLTAGSASGETTAPGDARSIATTTALSSPAPVGETWAQPGHEAPVGDSPVGPAAAPPARKAAESRSYRLTRQLPDGTVKEHSTTFTSLRAATQAAAYTLADNGAADRKDAAAFASRLQDAGPGTTMTHPSGYSFTISLVAAVAPLANMDLAAELDCMPGTVFARWLSMGAAPPAARDLDYERPGAGSWAVIGEDGIEITVSGPGVTRHGLLSWPQIASWIDKGVTPARLGIVGAASRLGAFVEQHHDQLAAAGTCDPGAIATELAQIRASAIAAIVEAAQRSRGTAMPVPPALPGDPAWHTVGMITRPDRTAGKVENAVLERLTRLRTAIREPQPTTAAEIRAAIRRWTRYGGLPDLVRGLDSPAAMRAWISEQASRRGEGQYDSSGECWYGSSPDGLITDRNGDDRAPVLIRWEEIPAWIQPGITSSQRDRLLAADAAVTTIARRRLTAAVHPNAGHTTPGGEEDKHAGGQLTEAVDAAWAAIEAAPPPSPADLENARHVYRDTGPVQPALFDDPEQDSTSTQGTTRAIALRQPRPAPPRPDGTGRPAATTGADPARPPGTPEQDPAIAAVPTPVGPAHADDPEPPQTLATNSDLAIALHFISDQELTSFLSLEKTPEGHGSLTSRREGLPDAGASQMLYFDRGGVRITVSSPRSHRHGQISWRQVASWIDTGLPPGRLGIIIGASQLGAFTNARRDQLIAVGKDNIDAAITELRQISKDAIDAALSAALAARDADAPVPPASRGKPAYRTTAMLTRPDPAATAAENTALTRIAELESAIRGAQPLTAADIKGTIRWWIGDDLPEYARALASPESMRAWIGRQVGGPASRPGTGTYDSALGRYYNAFPEGLRTSKGSDTRVTPYILWEEIPAWIQPGLSASLRDRLATAEPRPAPGRKRTAPARPPAGAADPASQADDPLPRPLREAIDAAWAAIDAASPPSPADLDHARTLYRATGTVQQALPGSPAETGQPGRPAIPAPRPGTEPAAPEPRPAPAAPRQEEPPPAAGADVPAGVMPRREPVALPQPAATPDLLTDDDVFLGISRLPAFVIGELFHAIDTSQSVASVSRQLASYSGERAVGEPDPGAREAVTPGPAGLRIQVDPAGSRRTGLITWQQVDDLLRPGTPPARRQIVKQAWRVRIGFMAANASFRAVGEGRLAAAAEDELRAQATAAVSAILAAAHPASGGQAAQPADEDATVNRIADLAAALPSESARPRTPAGQVTTGDVIGHPGYRFQPFRVAAPPRHTDTAVEITGHLTEPTGTEPIGPITLTLPVAGQPGPFVSVIPAPACSLWPLFPGHDTAAGTGQPADACPDHTPAETAAAPSDAAPAPDTETLTSQPDAQDRTQEETMPPAAHPTALSGPPASPGPGTAPQAPADAPAPTTPKTAGQRDADRNPSSSRAADRPGDGASAADEIDRVLDAIRERRGMVPGGHPSDDFSDIRRAFAAMRDALGLPAASPGAGPLQPAPAPAPAPAASRPPRGEPHPAADGFPDLEATLANLRDILGLPARGRHARSDGASSGTDTSVADALDEAAAEAQACARWYRDTPEWQRIGTVGRAARDLITAIREAAGDYWAEIRLDIRVRGFARTLAARTALAVSGAAHVLAGRLERAGRQDTRTWQAVWRLHRATTTFASRVMRYTPPGSPDSLPEARRIIDDLSQRQNCPGQPGPGRHAAPRGMGGARTPNAATLASASFPVMVARANAGQATAASAARTPGACSPKVVTPSAPKPRHR